MLELIKKNYWWLEYKTTSGNIFKDARNVNKTKFNI